MIELLDGIVGILNDYMYSYILIILLLGVGLYYTVKTGFIQFDLKSIALSFNEGVSGSSNSGEKKISPFEAFAVTTASRVGTGNIAGVAVAIVAGGPGAVFWMWVTALLGGALSFVESTLAQVYKSKEGDPSENRFLGGPAHYLEKGLGLKSLGTVFTVLLFLVFGLSFNALQANTIALSLETFNVPIIYSAIALSIISAVFIFKGLASIARAASYLVPIMAILYLVLCGVVIISNITRVPEVFGIIFQNAFGIREFGTGTLIGTIVMGVRRGLFSNEAGMGSAPNAAAAAKTSHPAKQGFIQAGGVFFDTILICSATAFLIMFSLGDTYLTSDLQGIALTQSALSSSFGDFGALFLTLCCFLFSFSSILGNYFYVRNSIPSLSSNKTTLIAFQSAVVLSVFVGSLTPLGLVWDIADLLMGLMTLINLYAILRLSKVVMAVLDDYKKQRAEGKDPVFKDSEFECW